ncbi:Protein kinase-like domain, partial [Trinorchestia longiramus]
MTECEEVSGMLKPGTSIKPILNEDDIPHLVKSTFGLDVISFTKLNAYDDLNFCIKVGKTSTNKNIPSPADEGYVFKVMNSIDSQLLELLTGQNEFMLHLNSKNYCCSLPLRTTDNQYLPFIQLPADPNHNAVRSHVARLLSFVPGRTLHSVTLTPELCREAGRYLASMHHDLQDFHNKAIATRCFIWMMSQTLEVRKFIHAVTDEAKLTLVQTALSAWETK